MSTMAQVGARNDIEETEVKQADSLVVIESSQKLPELKSDGAAAKARTHTTDLVLKEDGRLDLPQEGTDPKVMEFLRILDEYRLKNENEGNYEEAQRASKQLDNLRKQEMKRQIKALKARQLAERQDIQVAHNVQFAEFNKAWDKYMQDFDEMAQQYIKQMTDRHASELKAFQDKLYKQLTDKPPKFSKELLEWRRRQHILARQKNYAEAQKIKRIADMMEAKEKGRINGDWKSSFSHKESKLRNQQKSELSALLKRIEVRRKEHLAQQAADSKRLLQRNRNVQAVLASKQATEERTQKEQIKLRLTKPRKGVFGDPVRPRDKEPRAGLSKSKMRRKKARDAAKDNERQGQGGEGEGGAFLTQQ